MRKLLRNRKALSPVVAAIILIAVTVAVSIAVAAWMGALTIGFMATEQIAFTDCAYDLNLAYANVTIKNTGTSILTIDRIQINNKLNTAGTTGWTVYTDVVSTADETLNPGEEIKIKVDAIDYPPEAGISSTGEFMAGGNYAFTVITSKNNQFGPYTKAAPT